MLRTAALIAALLPGAASAATLTVDVVFGDDAGSSFDDAFAGEAGTATVTYDEGDVAASGFTSLDLEDFTLEAMIFGQTFTNADVDPVFSFLDFEDGEPTFLAFDIDETNPAAPVEIARSRLLNISVFSDIVADPSDGVPNVEALANFSQTSQDALAPVPLPAGLPLLGLGLAAMALTRRRA